jgi:hypothetical protein
MTSFSVLAVVLCTILLVVPLCTISVQASGTTTIIVSANPLWTDTGLNVGIGDTVNIRASGNWSWGVPSWVGPEGKNGTSAYWDIFYDKANQSELIAFFGSDPYQGHWGDGSFFPQTTGYWTIGSGASFTSDKNGRLWLGINDDAVSKKIEDNGGSVTANISISTPLSPSINLLSTPIVWALAIVALYLVLVAFAAVLVIVLIAGKRKANKKYKISAHAQLK